MSAQSDELPRGSRAPHFVRGSRSLHLCWRVGVFIVGLAVVAAGVVMLVLPGPGWLVIFAGLAVWASEFVWAQRVTGWMKQQLRRWADRARRRVRGRRAARRGTGEGEQARAAEEEPAASVNAVGPSGSGW